MWGVELVVIFSIGIRLGQLVGRVSKRFVGTCIAPSRWYIVNRNVASRSVWKVSAIGVTLTVSFKFPSQGWQGARPLDLLNNPSTQAGLSPYRGSDSASTSGPPPGVLCPFASSYHRNAIPRSSSQTLFSHATISPALIVMDWFANRCQLSQYRGCI